MLFLALCMPEAIDLNRTIGLLKKEYPPFGICENKQPVHNFTECIGTCSSSTSFNKSMSVFYSYEVISFECTMLNHCHNLFTSFKLGLPYQSPHLFHLFDQKIY